MNKLENVSDAELQQELKRRADERAAQAKREQEAREGTWLHLLEHESVITALRLMLPAHSCNTCKTDHDFVNVDRCTRCTVLYAAAHRDAEVLTNLHISIR